MFEFAEDARVSGESPSLDSPENILLGDLCASNESRLMGRVGGEKQFVRICDAMRYLSSVAVFLRRMDALCAMRS
jgi:hypothetical protein